MATRRERVVLDLQDNFTGGMARAAAATALLNRELNSLSGQSLATARSSQTFSRDIQRIGNEANGAGSSINQLTGRLRLLAEVATVAGPSLIPLGGVAAAGFAGLASQLGFAAVAGGVLIGSMQGLGDALGAMNKAQLEPTEKNLQAAEDALKRLSPAAREFAEAAFDLKPALVAIRDMGAEALMPGLVESLESLETLGPRVAQIFESVAGALGEIAAESSASLASERWAGFFEFIAAEAPGAIAELAATVGSLTHGLAELWMAFSPLNAGVSDWLVETAAAFDGWSQGLAETEGFQDFVAYIRETGPQVADTLGALSDAVVQIVQAASPLGGPVLAALEGVANAVAAIADSPIGPRLFTMAAAFVVLNKALAITTGLLGRLGFAGAAAALGSRGVGAPAAAGGAAGGLTGVTGAAQRASGAVRTLGADVRSMSTQYAGMNRAQSTLIAGMSGTTAAAQRTQATLATTGAAAGKAALGVGAFALVATESGRELGLTNTAMLGLMGTMVSPGMGTAIGVVAGGLLDIKAAGERAEAEMRAFEASLQGMSLEELNDQLAATQRALAGLEGQDLGGMGGDIRAQLGNQAEAVEKQIDALADAERRVQVEAKGAALEFLIQTDANVNLAKWSGKSAEQIKAQADAIKESRKEANETAQSFVSFGDSLNDSKTSLGQWIKDMASTADALNNFTTNSIRAGKRGLEDGLIRQLQAAGKEGALRMRQLANGTKDSIDEANAAFRKGEKAIERYNNYKVPPKVVRADVSNAMSGFLGVDRYLSTLDGKTATTYVNTVRTVTGPQGAAVFGQQADGGTIEGPRQPYGDKMLYLLAPGEEVISNRHGQADKHRPLLKAINGGLADGGTSGKKGDKRKFSGGEFVSDNTAALEQAIRSLTSVAEDQTRAVEDSTRKTDLWANKMSDVAQATVAGFSTALFETRDIAGSSNPWAAGAMGARTEGGWLENLTKDISGLQTRSGLQSQLAGMGLSGDALAALLSEGTNEDISGLINSGGVSQYASLYAQRSALQSSVGAAAGQQAFGRQHAESLAVQNRNAAAAEATQASMAQMQRQIERQAQALERIEQNAPERTGAAVGAAVNGPAKSAAIGGPTKPGKPK